LADLHIFLCNSTPEQSKIIFTSLIRRIFSQKNPNNTSLLSNFYRACRCWLSDGLYDVGTLETALKEQFGNNTTMFDCRAIATSGTKVAVTATAVKDNSAVLFTSYNGSGRECGMYRNG
jgi:hypothetical protein